MSKVDRVAIILSILYGIFLLILEDSRVVTDAPALMLFLPVIGYWIYRFIQGDISFLPGFLKK